MDCVHLKWLGLWSASSLFVFQKHKLVISWLLWPALWWADIKQCGSSSVCPICVPQEYRRVIDDTTLLTHTHTHTHTHNRFTALWILSGTTRVSRYQKKHSPTHTYRGHQSSLICFIHLLRSTASCLFNPRAWQSVSTVSKFSLVLVWLPPLHTPYISSPNHCLLFATHAHTIAACFAVVLLTRSLTLTNTNSTFWYNPKLRPLHILSLPSFPSSWLNNCILRPHLLQNTYIFIFIHLTGSKNK